jgi:hypothetical protein
MIHTVTLSKLLVSLIASVLVLLFCYRRDYIKKRFQTISEIYVFWGSVVLFRVVPFVIGFWVLNYYNSSDVIVFYKVSMPILDGKLIYRDYFCPYAPLFPYFVSIALRLWPDPKAISILLIVTEVGILLLTKRAFKNHYKPEELLFRTVLYLMMPASIILSTLTGQEDIWMWFFALLVYFVSNFKNSGLWGGIMMGLGQVFTKVILIIPVLPMMLIIKKPWQFMVGMALVGIPTLAILYYLVGLEFLQPLQEANAVRSPNIGTIINPWTYNTIHLGAKWLNWVGLLVTFTVSAFVYRYTNGVALIKSFAVLWVITYGTMMIVQQSAYSHYIYIFLMPLVFSMIDFKSIKEVLILLVFNITSVVQPSLWWLMGQPIYKKPSDIFSRIDYTADYVMQVVIVACVVYYIYTGFKYLKKCQTLPKYQS